MFPKGREIPLAQRVLKQKTDGCLKTASPWAKNNLIDFNVSKTQSFLITTAGDQTENLASFKESNLPNQPSSNILDVTYVGYS